MADVSLRHITKTYPNGTRAIDDFTVDISDKEFLVLVGPSGCGKSTLLRIIAGLESVDEGDIFIDGVRVNDMAPDERDIAMVFQNYALYPHMSVYENMAFALRLRAVDTSEIDRLVRQAAELLEIGDILERKPAALSGGQRQRVAMGRAIVRSPRVFLMDEPLSNLDPQLRGQLRSLISRLHAQLGTTFIYVTHDQIEAMTLGSTIVVMKNGVIQQIGRPRDVYNKPANTFVASFIGSPAMNLIEGEIVGGDLRIEGVRFGLPAGLSGRGDKRVLVGVRPENVRVSCVPGDGMYEAMVEVRELMGNESLIHCAYGGFTIGALTSNLEINIGDTVYIGFDVSKVHYFDSDTLERLS